MSEKLNGATAADQEENQTQFAIQRIYIKDVSFESPHSPEVFTQDWEPNINLDLNTDAVALPNHHHEVTLNLTIEVKNQEKIAFLVEVKQAGVFYAEGFDPSQLQHLLTVFCPNILFPYAREAISSLVSKGSFPDLHLSPINFEALYQQQIQTKQ